MKTAPEEHLNSLQSPKNANLEKKFGSSPVPKNADPQEDFNNPSPKNTHAQEKFGSSPLHNNTYQQDDFDHPTFTMNTPMENGIPSPLLPKSTTMEEVFYSSAASKKRVTAEGFCNIRTFQHSRWGFVGSDMYTESSDDTREFKGSLTKESLPFMEKKDAKRRSSLSSMEEQIPESSECDELIDKGFTTREKWPSTTGSHEKPPFMLRCSKRLHSQEDIKLCQLSPTSSSSKEFLVTEEINRFQGASEQTQENGLGRAIEQFALVLERYKTKMKSQTSKKSSVILASVADRIHFQLQGVVSQIQADVGKFTNLSKSKRKCLESRFQEASHRKLLVQVEEAIEIQLCDAEKSIAAIHKATRTKMQELKHALEECLSEGLFS
ncbi:meiosis-specific protein ASY3-like isoform X2 [Magnolia sinica]|uniref:meiosis-specific protein ASY3-like isoform X2 n=1 Tax=Magnolia sinica TaxID=86752 RepID=UPI002658BF2C|nr:meiosis-specific protein ASY3-like isoform X2 [Magnolia sinica]